MLKLKYKSKSVGELEMRKINRYIKKYSVLFITFFIINIFFIWILSNILSLEKNLKAKNSLLSENAKTIYFQGFDSLDKNNILKLFNDKKIILESILSYSDSKETPEIKGVYYNYDIDKNYPLKEGRMFSVNEILNKEKVAIVSNDIKNNITDGNINVQGEKYKVLGVFDKDDKIKNTIYINLDSKEVNLISRAITLDFKDGDISKLIEDIKNEANKSNVEVLISDPYGLNDPLEEALGENKIHIILGVLSSICLISTVINISTYWIDKEKAIIGIKSLVGGTKLDLIVRFYIEYILVILITIVISLITWTFVFREPIKDIWIIGTLIILNILVSTIAFITPLFKLCRLNINSIIKENI